MKYLFTIVIINTLILTSLGQETLREAPVNLEQIDTEKQEALTAIAKIEIQDMDDGTGLVKVWIRSSEVENLDYLSMQFSGQRIPRSTVLSALKSESTISSSDGTHVILMTSSITLNKSPTSAGAKVSYTYKKSGPRNFRNIKAGQLLIFPPIVQD
jgi:hypothetical protein